jgi:hypothetical protein
VAAALIVAGVLLTRGTNDEHATAPPPGSGTTAPHGPLSITSIASFDPQGDHTEADDQLPKAIDGDPNTYWHTEYYNDRNFSSSPTKHGVGVVVGTAKATALSSLQVTSPTKDWAAQVYVSDQKHDALADWGKPVATLTGIQGNASFDLHGAQGQYVLLWITDLGTGPPGPGAKGAASVTVMIDELSLDPA